MAKQQSELEIVIRGEDQFSPELQRIESRLIRAIGAISAAIAGIRIGTAPILAAAEFERAMADVAKTTEFVGKKITGTLGPLDELSDALLKISLRVDVTAADLAKIAAAAGQQGLGRFGVRGIIQFTDSVARMASVLDLSADEAGVQVGKIINIFKLPLNDIERAVSTFNEVANNSTASGEELLDVVRRLGDAAGSLKLGESVAIAATALDLGASPEVAGTALSKFFTAALQKAEEFGKLMGESAEQWADRFKEDGGGIKAFQAFLAKLRTLDAVSQQAALIKLVEGGRGGALFNKFIQDTTNSVLTRNLASSDRGDEGLSALKEQRTVLDTLEAQTTILLNSFRKLGVEASDALIGPLTQYAAQLSATLQSPEVQSFFGAIVRGLGDMIGQLVSAIKFVASLNVNWENFIKVLGFFVEFKIAKTLLGMAAGFKVFGTSLKSVAGDAAAATAATTKLGQASQAAAAQVAKANQAASTSLIGRVLGLAEMEKAIVAETAALRELKIAQDAANASRATANAVNQKALQAAAAAGSATTGVQNFSGQVAQQRAALRQAEQRAAAAVAAQAAALAARQQAQAQQTAQNRLQIEQDYQRRRAAIVATGTERGLKALRAERTAALAAEEAANQRSLRGIEQYYARRAAIQNTALQAEVVRERAALAQRLAVFDGLVADQSRRAAAAGAAAAAAAAASAGAAAATQRLTALQIAATAASTAVANLGLMLRTLATFAVAAGRILVGAFFWITILYTIADSLGLLDNLGSKFQKLTDLIGLTSKAQRDKAIQDEKDKKRIAELTALINTQTEAYKRNLDARTQTLDQEKVSGLIQQVATAPTEDLQTKALTELAQTLSGAESVATAVTGATREIFETAIKGQEKVIEDAKTRLRTLEGQLQNALKFNSNEKDRRALSDSYGKQIAQIVDVIDSAQAKIDGFNKSLGNSGEEGEAAARGLTQSADAVARLFTPQSLAKAQEYLIPLARAKEEAAKAQQALTDLDQKAREGSADAAAAVAPAMKTLTDANKVVRDLDTQLQQFLATQRQNKGLPAETLRSYEALVTLLKLALPDLQALVNTAAKANPINLDGSQTPVPPPPSTGDGDVNSNKEESRARKLARARLQLRRAEIQAENALYDEFYKQRQQKEQDAYDQGLVSIQRFYDDREEIQQAALSQEIADKREEVKAVEFELKGAQDEIERTRFQTDKVRLEGQIKALTARRGTLTDANEEARRRAIEDFNDQSLSESLRLRVEDIIPSDASTIFTESLGELQARYRTFLNQLRAEGNGALANSIELGFNFQAFEQSIEPARNAIDDVFGQLGRLQSRIDLARANNSITGVQAENLYTDAIKEQLPILEAKLALMERELVALGKVAPGSVAYQRQAAAIDEVRLRLQQLRNETDLIARGVNEGLTQSLASALDKLTQYGSSLKDVINGLLLEVANNIKQIFLQDIAQRITQSIGAVGAGGFGGFIGGALRGGQADVQGKTPGTPVYVWSVNQQELPASTSLIPGDESGFSGLFTNFEKGVTDFFAKLKITPLTPAIPPVPLPTATTEVPTKAEIEGLFQGFTEKVSGFFGDLLGNVQSALGFGTAVADTAGAATEVAAETANTTAVVANTTALTAMAPAVAASTTTLSTSLASLSIPIAALLSALPSLAAAAEAAALALANVAAQQTASGIAAAVAHTGGTIGVTRLPQRIVPPATFARAKRLHSGGTGIKPGEVPAILQESEAVLTANQQDTVSAALQSGNKEVAIRNVLVTDPAFVTDAMASSQGERTLVSMVTKNRVAMRQALGL